MATPSTLSRRALPPNSPNLKRGRPLLRSPPTPKSRIASLNKSDWLRKSRQSSRKRIHIQEKSSIRLRNCPNLTSTFNRKKSFSAKSKDRHNFLTVQQNGFPSKKLTSSKSNTLVSFSLAKDTRHLSFIRFIVTLWSKPIATTQEDIYPLSHAEESSREMSTVFSKYINSYSRKESSTTVSDPTVTTILKPCP